MTERPYVMEVSEIRFPEKRNWQENDGVADISITNYETSIPNFKETITTLQSLTESMYSHSASVDCEEDDVIGIFSFKNGDKHWDKEIHIKLSIGAVLK